MALGCIWHAQWECGMDKLLAEADHQMYEDKRAYYAAGKFDRRR